MSSLDFSQNILWALNSPSSKESQFFLWNSSKDRMKIYCSSSYSLDVSFVNSGARKFTWNKLNWATSGPLLSGTIFTLGQMTFLSLFSAGYSQPQPIVNLKCSHCCSNSRNIICHLSLQLTFWRKSKCSTTTFNLKLHNFSNFGRIQRLWYL